MARNFMAGKINGGISKKPPTNPIYPLHCIILPNKFETTSHTSIPTISGARTLSSTSHNFNYFVKSKVEMTEVFVEIDPQDQCV